MLGYFERGSELYFSNGTIIVSLLAYTFLFSNGPWQNCSDAWTIWSIDERANGCREEVFKKLSAPGLITLPAHPRVVHQ
jgi:hypothetical protein